MRLTAATTQFDFDLERRPVRLMNVATMHVDSSLVLASESCDRPVMLDAVSAAIWDSLDGYSTVGDIADDLVAALGGRMSDRAPYVDWLCRALAQDGLVDDPGATANAIPRRLFPIIPPDSCLGKQLGLGRIKLVQVRANDGSMLRFGSTIGKLSDEMSSQLDVVPLDDVPIETIVLRATLSPSGRPRLQQLFDTLGNPLWAGRDIAVAGSALRRTVGALLDTHRGPWLQGLTIMSEDRAVIVHPALRDLVVDQARPILERNGMRIAPCGMVLVDPQSGSLVVPADSFTGESAIRCQFGGVVMPRFDDAVERARALLHIARRWDQPHLDLIATLGPPIQVDPEGTAMDVATCIARACLGTS